MSLINEKKDFSIISSLIPERSSVIDIGCNDGSLLEYLEINKKVDGRGMEIDQEKVQLCLSKGISVIEGDADKDLGLYPEKSLDYVILSQTIQATLEPEKILTELTRIGKRVIVSIPNFGFWKVRLDLLVKGKMPITSKLNSTWFETEKMLH